MSNIEKIRKDIKKNYDHYINEYGLIFDDVIESLEAVVSHLDKDKKKKEAAGCGRLLTENENLAESKIARKINDFLDKLFEDDE